MIHTIKKKKKSSGEKFYIDPKSS